MVKSVRGDSLESHHTSSHLRGGFKLVWTVVTVDGTELGEYEGSVCAGDTIEFGYTELYVTDLDEQTKKITVEAVYDHTNE